VILDAFEALEGAIDVRAVALRDGPLADRCARLAPPFIPAAPAYGRLDRLRGWPQSVRARKEARSLARWQPDLIYVNSVAALRVVSRIGLPSAPVLLHVHELDVVTARLLQGVDPELLTCWPDRYIAVSEPVARLLADRYGVDRDRISLIHEFVPDGLLDGYRYSAPRSDGAPLVVGGAGTPEWRKGTVLWLQMAVELVRLLGREQVRFRWVGLREDAESLYFAHMVRKLGLAEQVDLIPVTPDPFPHYVDFDVFAMTSWEDPCPIVVLENMALGTPVACYAGSGGAPEVVGDTGFVASGFSPQAMACGIAELACDTDRLHARGKAARERVRAYFTASVQAPRILTVMQQTTDH
jgi:glycosyltransferase involved in cell wall biosynthesis